MKNGDRYYGKVESMTSSTLVLQSEMLGKVILPRAKLAGINLGANASTPSPAVAAGTNAPATVLTGTNLNIAAEMRKLGSNTNFIGQIQQQLLSGAGADANNKFNDMVAGLMSGKMDINALRAEAKSSAEQIRAMKKDLGNEAGASLDVYLDILDSFLKESAASPTSSTNAVH